jgi:hypothetical protein
MRSTAASLALLAALLLAGCAAFNTLSVDVASFGEWTADRKPGSYAFERLPSQQAQATETEELEKAALGALLKAGFTPVAPGQEPEFLVQVGTRNRMTAVQVWDDPIWWRGGYGYGYWRYGAWGSPYWSMSMWYTVPRYEREVAVLIRDRASGKPLFEARASSEGGSNPGARTLAGMFDAALMDFPKLGVNPRRVVVTLPE